jgi:glyoxylase-like metal-dependent hydrolase (beta-lactamase superfamily II)
VLFAGDLLENGAAPYFGDGYPLEWPATIEAIIGLSATTIAPGHGEVADRAFVERSLEEVRAIADLGRAVAAGEISVDEAFGRSPYKPKASREPIERAAAQARGELD